MNEELKKKNKEELEEEKEEIYIERNVKLKKYRLYKNKNDINWHFVYYISVILNKFVNKIKLKRGEHCIYLRNVEDLEKVINFLKNNVNCQFKLLMDICGIDYLGKQKINKKRFEVNYNLLSIKYNLRIQLKVSVDEFTSISSIKTFYKAADWYEREVWDMYGLFFKNHKDLRRILTDYGFEGFPLRKDFPQSGYVELRYNNDYKHLVYEPVELSQAFRYFDFISPWNIKI